MTQLALPFDRRKRKQRPALLLNANDLTAEVVQHIRKLGGWATRVNVSGFYDPEKGFWRRGVTDPGTPDVLAVLNGQFIGIDVKTGTDRLRLEQKQTSRLIQNAKGIFIVARTLEQFREDLRLFNYEPGVD